MRSLIRSKSSIDSSMPISLATASRCRTPLVEPPLHGDRGDRVLERLARDDVARAQAALEHVHHQLAGLARRRRPCAGPSAGTIEKPAGEMPSTSNAIAIVLAVNWPPQAPAPGRGGVLELGELARR